MSRHHVFVVTCQGRRVTSAGNRIPQTGNLKKWLFDQGRHSTSSHLSRTTGVYTATLRTMSAPCGVSIDKECIVALNELISSRGPSKIKFVIFRVADDEKAVMVEETSSEQDYETFRQKLTSAVDKLGKPAPRYAVYDVDYDLGENGKSTMGDLKKALNLDASIHADNLDEIEWESVVKVASGGKV
ncbi:hypothetical protein FZEAL_4523 [Fusarium zealandicum]|uniref:Cofilin n=1 Tax=Fusarium zealandicum TaxID=1053134 RepID=A0A8H4XKP7_9HYPO|nr:hypothetical protein FZEAL_4523 [Fusarium zealandicum]